VNDIAEKVRKEKINKLPRLRLNTLFIICQGDGTSIGRLHSIDECRLIFSLNNGYYNCDGTTDIRLFQGSSGLWAIRGYTRVYFGGSNDLSVTR
jgi:hypothetical protein